MELIRVLLYIETYSKEEAAVFRNVKKLLIMKKLWHTHLDTLNLKKFEKMNS